MLLLPKGGLNHLWKALKIINVLKSWDLSDLSITDRKAKNPKSYIVNWEDFPANPDGNTWKENMATKHSLCFFLLMLWAVPEKRKLVWPHGVLIYICPSHQALSSYFWALQQSQFLCDKLHWRNSSTGSWTGVSHGGNNIKAGNLPPSKSQKNTTWVNFLLDMYHIRPKKPNHKILLKNLFPYLTAGWDHPNGSSSAKDAALVILLTKTAWRSIRKKEFSGKVRNHTWLPKTSGFS